MLQCISSHIGSVEVDIVELWGKEAEMSAIRARHGEYLSKRMVKHSQRFISAIEEVKNGLTYKPKSMYVELILTIAARGRR